jgi:hypothetical protein
VREALEEDYFKIPNMGNRTNRTMVTQTWKMRKENTKFEGAISPVGG